MLRRPLGRDRVESAPPGEGGIDAALAAANQGSLEKTLALTERLLHDDPLDANAYFVRGLAELGVDDPHSAAASLRRALYVDPAFGLAAFQLGRAHERRGDSAAAARAYEQALHTLEPGDGRHDAILDQVDLGDVASACAMRLKVLRGAA
jgi:tetratricopeptide (TPR) repeat protein